MDYRIVELEGFKLAGVKMSSTNENQQGMKDCETFWNQFISGNRQETVAPLINREPFGVIGASFIMLIQRIVKNLITILPRQPQQQHLMVWRK